MNLKVGDLFCLDCTFYEIIYINENNNQVSYRSLFTYAIELSILERIIKGENERKRLQEKT